MLWNVLLKTSHSVNSTKMKSSYNAVNLLWVCIVIFQTHFVQLITTFQTHFVQLTKPSQVFVRPTGIQALPSPVNSTIKKTNIHLVPLGVLRDNKSLSSVLRIQIHENRKTKLPDRLADSCKHSSVNWMAAGLRLPRSSQGFCSFFYFSNTLCSVDSGLCKTYWYTGSAFTS